MKHGTQWASQILLSLFILLPESALCIESSPADKNSFSPPQADFSLAEIEALVIPIAMYPDVILQPILAAATFPDQIVDASLLIQSKQDSSKIKDQSWDQSVKIIATYPGILKMMSSKLDWTTDLGVAFLNQHRDVLTSIQRERANAAAKGTLQTTEEQKVVTETTDAGTTIIQIQPTNPEVVYVPTTSTTTVVESSNSTSDALVPLVAFGAGLAVGSMFDDDDDVNVYYGGWGHSSYWHDDDHFDQWADNRREVWEDHNDRAWDRQDHRQDMQSNRQDFRQERIEQGNRTPQSPEQRQARKNQVEANKQNRQSSPKVSADKKAQMQSRAQQPRAQQSGSQQARAQNRGWNTDSSSAKNAGSFGGTSSRASTSRASSRGVSSRSSAGQSRVARSGGGRRR